MNDFSWKNFAISTVVVTQAAQENEDRRMDAN